MQELEYEHSQMTDEELRQEKEHQTELLDELIKKADAANSQKVRIPIPESVKLFEELADAAHVIAEGCLLDVLTEIRESGIGMIRFRFEYMFFYE